MSRPTRYSDEELDALREVANIGAGAAATELYRLTGSGVGMAVPHSRVLLLEEVLDAFGSPDAEVTAIGVEVSGELDMLMALLLSPGRVPAVTGAPGGDGRQAVLLELGDRLSVAFTSSIGDLTGMQLQATVAGVVTDMLGAVVQALVAPSAASQDQVLLVDLDLDLEEGDADVRLLCAPRPASVKRLLERLGVSAHPDQTAR